MEEVYICDLCYRAYKPIFNGDYPKILRTFGNYTIDLRLKQFRRVIHHEEGTSIEIIEFTSAKGQRLLAQMHEEVTR